MSLLRFRPFGRARNFPTVGVLAKSLWFHVDVANRASCNSDDRVALLLPLSHLVGRQLIPAVVCSARHYVLCRPSKSHDHVAHGALQLSVSSIFPFPPAMHAPVKKFHDARRIDALMPRKLACWGCSRSLRSIKVIDSWLSSVSYRKFLSAVRAASLTSACSRTSGTDC